MNDVKERRNQLCVACVCSDGCGCRQRPREHQFAAGPRAGARCGSGGRGAVAAQKQSQGNVFRLRVAGAVLVETYGGPRNSACEV